MKTYSHTLSELCEILEDAVHLAEEHESLKERLRHIDVKRLISLSKEAEPFGAEALTKKLVELNLFSDESGARRRDILDTKNFEVQKGAFNTTYRDILSSYQTRSACSFLFLNANKKFVHAYFIIDKEKNQVSRVSFNETIYNATDPAVVGSINTLNHVERGYKTLLEYK